MPADPFGKLSFVGANIENKISIADIQCLG